MRFWDLSFWGLRDMGDQMIRFLVDWMIWSLGGWVIREVGDWGSWGLTNLGITGLRAWIYED